MFESREQAGRLLVKKLEKYRNRDDVFILGIPRGGVVVAKVVADALEVPLDIVVVKKIGAPDNPELAIGAVGPLKAVYWDEKLCRRLGIDKNTRNQELRIKHQEREKREKLLRGDDGALDIKNKIVLVVDDGVATGATSIVAAKYAKRKGVKEVILAIPVIVEDTFSNIKRYFDDVIFLEIPEDFYAVGQFYKEFPQVSDEEVSKLLRAERLVWVL